MERSAFRCYTRFMLSTRTFITVLLLCCMLSTGAEAVVYPDRPLLLNPLAYDMDGSGLNFFPLLGAWASGAHYAPLGQGIGDHAWNTAAGCAAEMLRFDKNINIVLASDFELVSDRHSKIGFNPRSFFWQQVLMVSGYLDPWGYWQAGFVHRCKHDVDTLGLSGESSKKREAVMIYDSVFLRVIAKTITPVHSHRFPFALQPYGRFDIFVIRDDERTYDTGVTPGRSIEDLSATLESGLTCEMIRIGPAVVYMRGRYMLSCFGAGRGSDYTNSGIAETGVTLHGTEGIAAVFAAFEYQDMTMVNPYNEHKRFLLFGLRLYDGRMYY